MESCIVYDVPLFGMGFPKPMAEFGVIGKDRSEHNPVSWRSFLCDTGDTVSQMVMILFSVVFFFFFSICPSSVNEIIMLSALRFLPKCQYLPVWCSVPGKADDHLHSHFRQTVPECETVTGHQTSASDIRHCHTTVSDIGSGLKDSRVTISLTVLSRLKTPGSQ